MKAGGAEGQGLQVGGGSGAHSLTIPFLCFISLASTTLANCSRACTVCTEKDGASAQAAQPRQPPPPPTAVPPPAAYQLSAPIQLRVDEATEAQATAQPRPPSRNGESDRLVGTPHPGPCPSRPKLTSSAVCPPLRAGGPRSQRGSLERCQVQKVPSLCPVWEEAPTVRTCSPLLPPTPHLYSLFCWPNLELLISTQKAWCKSWE